MSGKFGGSRNMAGLVAVVTGAAQGLGLAISERLARDGVAVIMADLQLDGSRSSLASAPRKSMNNPPACGGLMIEDRA